MIFVHENKTANKTNVVDSFAYLFCSSYFIITDTHEIDFKTNRLMPTTRNGHTTNQKIKKLAAVKIAALLKIEYGNGSKEGIVCKI